MINNRLSTADKIFRNRFESHEIDPDDFDHRAHLRLAYSYLVGQDCETAYESMKNSLLAFLAYLGVADGKYHDTMTKAWVLAVRHFMEKTPTSKSADQLIDANPIMLDSKIMLSHYSVESLFSEQARKTFIEPDLDPIPRYG